MAVRPVVHQVDGGQKLRIVQLTLAVKKEFSFLSVNSALNLTPVIVQLIEGNPRLNVSMKVLHMEHRSVIGLFC